jgi:hypothetical protein
MFVAFMLMHCFWLFEFKFEFEFICLCPFPKMQNLFPSPLTPTLFWHVKVLQPS